MKRILIIEDDKSIASLQKDYLEVNGYEATIASDGQSGLEKALDSDYDLIVLDVMLPVLDGFAVCKSIRAQKDTPIILLTAKSEEIDKIRGLNLGADDYITKPFSFNELVARVNSQINRFDRLTNRGKTNLITYGNLRIDLDAHRVFISDKEVSLTNKEFELLSFLAQNPNKVFSRDKLLDQIWGYENFGDNSTVTVHIKRIREKIETDPALPKYIDTVWGAGYRFMVEGK